MHTIDLKNKGYRTDLVIDEITREKDTKLSSKILEKTKNVTVEEVIIDKKTNCNKKKGIYETISFTDITDKNNFKEVEELAIKTLKNMLNKLNISSNAKILVVGLGNASSTPDALGPKTLDHVLVTRHLFLLGDVEEGYRNVASFKPSVTGVTGIETKDLIEGIKEKIKPDILIVIDALASSSIERLNKTIQITSAGISPGSGVGNNRLEISQDTLHIPVIAIGVPTVVDGATIVENTLQLLLKKISYGLENKENEKLKLVPITNQNYLNHTKELSKEQKEDLLGMVGLLDEQELKSLILEVLLPVNYNMMVTPKEIDYLIEKLSLLLGNMINKSLHEHFNPTN
jgi:spore protease